MENPHKVDISSENVKKGRNKLNSCELHANMDHLLDSTLTET